jgi:GNAT superfamily N-acetyltransferase
MGLPAGYHLRAPTRDDLEHAAAVLGADDLDDAGEVVLDAGFLADQWDRVGFDLAADAWVVVDEAGAIVGYGQVLREEPDAVDTWGVVHPAHRGRGIGSALLSRTEERAGRLWPGLPSFRFRHAINAGDGAAVALLEARGLRLVRHFWHMSIELGESVDPGSPPEGIAITAMQTRDELADFHAVLDEAFADHGTIVPSPSTAGSRSRPLPATTRPCGCWRERAGRP